MARFGPALTWLLLLTFGVSFGLNYGTSNHTFYLLPSEHALHPELWQRDWAVNETLHYHFVFAELATLLLSIEPSGWLLALLNVLAVAVGMACVGRLLALLIGRERARLALLVSLALAAATRTGAPGTSYVFSDILQPNTLGSLGLVIASVLTVAGRPLASGLVLAGAGGLHANYLVLSLPVFAVAQLAQGRAGLFGRAVRQLLPAVLLTLAYLPLIHVTSSASVVAEAQRIYQDIRSPHHYRVERFAHELIGWLGWQSIGAGAILALRQSGEGPALRRLLGLLAGYWALIVPSLLLAGLLVLRPLMQLYPWRLTANCELLAQAAFAALVACSVSLPTIPQRQSRGELALLVGGLSLVGVGALVTGRPVPLLVGAVGLGVVLAAPRLAGAPARRERAALALSLVAVVGFLAINAGRLARLPQTSSLLVGRERGLEELCGWISAKVGVHEVLLTPPDDERIRFQCRRAIVVDWKTAPMVPDQVLAWYERVQDVTGRNPLRSAADLQGYASLDAARLQRLHGKYHFRYVVAYRDFQPPPGLVPVFRGSRFVAFEVTPVQ